MGVSSSLSWGSKPRLFSLLGFLVCSCHAFSWWLQHLLPKLLRDKDRPDTSCAPTPLPKDFKSKTLEQKQACCLLPEANQDRGFAKASCCVLLPALGPPPGRCLSTEVSQWDPCVLDEGPGELNHPWSGVLHQTLPTAFNYMDSPEGMWEADFPTGLPVAPASPSFPHPCSSTLSHCACPCASPRVGSAGWHLSPTLTFPLLVSDRDVLSTPALGSALEAARCSEANLGILMLA